jgi:hypothetical protein
VTDTAQVIHAGLYYGKDSLKTKLCLRGKEMMYDLCKENQIPHMNCGKWYVRPWYKVDGLLQSHSEITYEMSCCSLTHLIIITNIFAY